MIPVSSKMELGKDRAQAGNAAGRPIIGMSYRFSGKLLRILPAAALAFGLLAYLSTK
jgi:hypothetical protein